jgi:hypothetical protein
LYKCIAKTGYRFRLQFGADHKTGTIFDDCKHGFAPQKHSVAFKALVSHFKGHAIQGVQIWLADAWDAFKRLLRASSDVLCIPRHPTITTASAAHADA